MNHNSEKRVVFIDLQHGLIGGFECDWLPVLQLAMRTYTSLHIYNTPHIQRAAIFAKLV